MVPSLIWFSVSTKSHFDFCRYFLLNFQCQRRSFLSQCRFRWLGEKLYFCDSTSKAFAFLLLSLRGQTRCSKDYDSPRGLCSGKIDDLPIVTGPLRIQVPLHRQPCFYFIYFLFATLPRFATANHMRWIQICGETSCSFSVNSSSKAKICCRK